MGVAKIGIITTASADPLDSATFYEALFLDQYGAASATYIPVTETSGNADTQEVYIHHLHELYLVLWVEVLGGAGAQAEGCW